MSTQGADDNVCDALPLTPCVGVCRLDTDGLCVGCRRSMSEISGWRGLADTERLRLMVDVLPTRKPR